MSFHSNGTRAVLMALAFVLTLGVSACSDEKSSPDELTVVSPVDDETGAKADGTIPFACCSHCGRKNLIEPSQLAQANAQHKNIIMVCGTCGLGFRAKGTGGQLQTSTFIGGWALPNGQVGGGWVADDGNAYSADDYLMAFGTDPELAWNWLSAGEPEPTNRCR
jgi:hypothetical protein